jgi:FkbM family methyltransferase
VDWKAQLKLREYFYLLGMRPRPRVYGHEIVAFDLPGEGRIEYAQWLHPSESRKVIRQEAIDELRRFLAPGDVALDIGAHSGDSTLPIALAVGRQGCVLAFEPNPYVFPVLRKNAELNAGKTNIVPLMIAATPEPGDFHFEYSDAGFCNGGLHQGTSKWRHGAAFKLKVRGENLQAFIAGHFASLVPRIRYVKIDVEGYDLQVLESMQELVRQTRPCIKVEVFKLLTLEQRQRMYGFLDQLGYDVFLAESDTVYRGPRLNRECLMIRRHYDAFCVPRQ